MDTRYGFNNGLANSGLFAVDTRFSGSAGSFSFGEFTVDTRAAIIGSSTITGRVTDTNSVALAGASVMALQNNVVRAQTSADFYGNYALTTLTEGTYEVRVTKTDYLTANRYGINLTANQSVAQNFSLPGKPAAPVMVATNRAPESIATVTIANKQLKKFVGSGFVTNYTLNLSQMTVVFTHGWNSDPTVWATNMAANMKASGVTNANLLAWDWHEVARTEASLALSHVREQGDALGLALKNALGTSYNQPLHFIGHSLGTLVNAGAANVLHRANFDYHKTHMTLLDEGEMANEIPLGDVVTGLESLWGSTEAPRLGWLTPEPDSYDWMDNYISLVGLPHPYSVNVWLGQGIDRANGNGAFNYLAGVHRYACDWYGATALNPNSSILGNRYSFEQLGNGVNLQAASPYPSGSLFAQDLYPSDPNPLHELTGGGVASYVEFNALVFRQLSVTTFYAANAGINTLSGVGQTIGDAYVDVIEASGEVLANTSIWTYQTINGLGSQFFHSFRAVLRSGTSANFQVRASNGFHPKGLSNSSTTPPGVWLPIQVPTNAVVMAFDFTFTGDAGEDVLSASINSTNVFALAATYIPTNQTMHSGSIDVRRWAGQTVELFFGLLGGTTTNATLTVEAMSFYTPAAPILTAQTSGNNAVVQWPLSASDYILETTDNLAATNSWSTVTNSPAIIDLQNTVTNEIFTGGHFYRLKK